MSFVYQAKPEFRKKYRDFGFKKVPKKLNPSTDYIVYLVVQQPLDGECVRTLIDKVYNNPEWQRVMLSTNRDVKNYKKIGIEFEDVYNEDGTVKKQLIETPQLLEMFSCWRIDINFDDDWYLGFTISDDQRVFYDAEKVLDRYCEPIIQELLNAGMIEKVEVK